MREDFSWVVREESDNLISQAEEDLKGEGVVLIPDDRESSLV